MPGYFRQAASRRTDLGKQGLDLLDDPALLGEGRDRNRGLQQGGSAHASLRHVVATYGLEVAFVPQVMEGQRALPRVESVRITPEACHVVRERSWLR